MYSFLPSFSVVSCLWIVVSSYKSVKSGTTYVTILVMSHASIFLYLANYALETWPKSHFFPWKSYLIVVLFRCSNILYILDSTQHPVLSLFCFLTKIWFFGNLGPYLTALISLIVLIPFIVCVCLCTCACTNSFHTVCVFTCTHALTPFIWCVCSCVRALISFILCVHACTPFIVCVCAHVCALTAFILCVYVCACLHMHMLSLILTLCDPMDTWMLIDEWMFCLLTKTFSSLFGLLLLCIFITL